MSVQAALTKYQQYNHGCNDRLHVWMVAETPRGVDESIYAEVSGACEKHNVRLTVHVAEASRNKELIREC
jgi:cytosine/adenosine deaminase-related metal-dependent hydrolase